MTDNLYSETLDWLGMASSALVLLHYAFLYPAVVAYTLSFAVRWGNNQRLRDYIQGVRDAVRR